MLSLGGGSKATFTPLDGGLDSFLGNQEAPLPALFGHLSCVDAISAKKSEILAVTGSSSGIFFPGRCSCPWWVAGRRT